MRLNQNAVHDKKWVELKSCTGTGADTSVPLDADLSNAGIATCKGPMPAPAANTTETATDGAAAGGAAAETAATDAGAGAWEAKTPS